MTLKIQGPTPDRLLRKEWRLIQKLAYAEVANFWHKVIRPKHFTQAAKVEYGYDRRTFEYNRAKRKEFGHTLPLVRTGRSMRLTARRKISASSKRSTVLMPAGDIGSRQALVREELGQAFAIDLADEFTRISPKDRKLITSRLARSLEQSLRNVRGAKETRI